MSVIINKTGKNSFIIEKANPILGVDIANVKNKSIKTMKLTELTELVLLICRKLDILNSDGNIDLDKLNK